MYMLSVHCMFIVMLYTYIGKVVDCNEGVCIPDPANGLTANCLCPKNTSGQFCEMCKCRRRASGAVFDSMFWNRNESFH